MKFSHNTCYRSFGSWKTILDLQTTDSLMYCSTPSLVNTLDFLGWLQFENFFKYGTNLVNFLKSTFSSTLSVAFNKEYITHNVEDFSSQTFVQDLRTLIFGYFFDFIFFFHSLNYQELSLKKIVNKCNFVSIATIIT